MGYSVEELAELLGAKIYSQIDTEVTVNDFEYAPLPLKRNEKKGLCFISISNRRWSNEHRKKLKWTDGNQVALENPEKFDVLITENPIEALKDSKTQLIVNNSFRILEVLAKESRKKMKNTVIGITGSVGKSSTRLLMEHLLQETHSIVPTRGNHNTQSGVPLYGAKLCTNPDVGILEISLNALNNRGNQSLHIEPDVAMVTSIGEAHLSTLHSTENIAKFKARIFDGLKENGLAIINADIDQLELEILVKAAQKKTTNIKLYSVKSQNADLYLDKIEHKKEYTNVYFIYRKKNTHSN